MSSHQPLVSVIIPFYNTPQPFLREAVQSVLEQTYDNWELLLVDDGDRAGNRSYLQTVAHRLPERVRLLSHADGRNHGISASRQLGVEQARGAYIAFLDSDDIWLPDKLSRQVALMEQHPQTGMLYGNTLYWYSWAKEPTTVLEDYIPKIGSPIEGVMPPASLLPLFLSGKTVVPCTCSLLIRRSIFDKIGGFEKNFPGMYEDQVFYAKVCLEVPVYVSQDCLDWYRQHPLSISSAHEMASQARETRRAFLEWLQDYLIIRQIQDQKVWAALRRELWVLRLPENLTGGERAAVLVKRLKKWLLKLEGWLIPDPIGQSMWAPKKTIEALTNQR